MHLRLSSALGLPIMEEGSDEAVGTLSGMLIQPDTGKVEGFFVHVPHFLHSIELFCSSFDILRWGTSVHIRDVDVLSPPEERIRLQSLLEDQRTIVGQRIVSESGLKIGTCHDVQFDTKKMRIEWLFPRKFWKWGMALPVSEIVEVRLEAIVVRDPVQKESVQEVVPTIEIPDLPEAATRSLYKKTPENNNETVL